MIYVPSPIPVAYEAIYQALANKSGRMQYYIQKRGESRMRIGRGEFINAYNHQHILAMKPLPTTMDAPVFQLEFYTGPSIS